MRLVKLVGIVLMGLGLFSLMGSSPGSKSDKPAVTSAGTINWYDYDVGLKRARETDKHVFIDFTAKWCGYCRKMEREVFTDSTVIDLLNNDFVSVRVDGDSRRELDIDGYKITETALTKREFGVRGYPTFWFLKPDGTKLTFINGYRPTEYMLKALTYIKDYEYDSTATDKDTLESQN